MSIVIGIDVGISSTKILGIENGKRIKSPMCVKVIDDPVASLFGALGKYLSENDIDLEDVESVMITGVGSKNITADIYGLPTTPVDEFMANGLGARFDSGLDHIIVVSMGTGTSLVRVDGNDISHIGGIGMGGGTLQGLSHLLLGTNDVKNVQAMSQRGEISQINLSIDDITNDGLNNLTAEATASLFAKAHKSNPDDYDIALGLVWMVLETIGSCAVLSQLNGGFKDFVLIGNLTRLEECKQVFPMMEKLYGVRFIIPKYAPYCTALGAAISYGYQKE
jgi:type II pantothenate kinase